MEENGIFWLCSVHTIVKMILLFMIEKTLSTVSIKPIQSPGSIVIENSVQQHLIARQISMVSIVCVENLFPNDRMFAGMSFTSNSDSQNNSAQCKPQRPYQRIKFVWRVREFYYLLLEKLFYGALS